ncbi:MULTISPECIES: hypothetical protein [unclassified Thalassospira]|uniref:DUF7483 domain-containing protein n=1 Tax=unclassified Thalassospira TaxID=2648997 RepID=UPI001B211E1E|nr:hypothetical protein [Thalassospira sp.]MBO6771772.1 hypothetical protein [Thalassospira sp.]
MSLLMENSVAKIGCGDPGDPIEAAVLFAGVSPRITFPSSGGTGKVWAYSEWLKLPAIGNVIISLQSYVDDPNNTSLYWRGDLKGQFQIQNQISNSITTDNLLSGSFLAGGFWLHRYTIYDSTQADETLRYRVYVGGVLQPHNDDYPALNEASFIGASGQHRIQGNHYRAETALFVGTYPDVSSFGRFNAQDVWVHKEFDGKGGGAAIYGAAGAHFDFLEGADLTKDVSGNGNHATIVAGSLYQVSDTPTNSANIHEAIDNTNQTWTFSDGNTVVENDNFGGTSYMIRSSMPVAIGQFWAVMEVETIGSGTGFPVFGVSDASRYFGGSVTKRPDIAYHRDGTIRDIDNNVLQSGLPTYGVGDFVGIALDGTNQSVQFYLNTGAGKNPVGSPEAYSFTLATFALWSYYDARARLYYTDFPANMLAESGFSGLTSENYPCPLIQNPDDYVTVRLRSGGDGVDDLNWNPLLEKTLVVSKRRDAAGSFWITDTVRGAGLAWRSNVADEEKSKPDGLYQFVANGYLIGAGTDYQGNRADIIFRASPLAGFDIVEIEHVAGTPSTEAHNVGGAIQYAWVVPLDGGDRRVFHHLLPAGQYYKLNQTEVQTITADPDWLLSTANTVTLSASMLSGRYILYVWRGVPQFSAFGLHGGNGSVNGPFDAMDFKARLYLITEHNPTDDVNLSVADINPSNPVQKYLMLNRDQQEVTLTDRDRDLMPNGVKARASASGAEINNASGVFPWAAWASVPIKFATAH